MISVSAPNRIDFAGGTLDVYPIFLLQEGAVTVNAAISIYSHARVATRRDRKFVLYSKDLGKRKPFADLSALPRKGPFHLIAEAIRYFSPRGGLTVETENEAPKGSGLGASSALLVSLMKALSLATGRPLSRRQILHDASLVEAKVIGIPTGKQDYGGALFGGFRAYRWGMDRQQIKNLRVSKKLRRAMEERFLLAFTGISHFSAESNWQVLKRYVERDRRTQAAIRRIAQVARRMELAFENQDLPAIAELVSEEWFHRKQLALEVTTDRLSAMEEALREIGVKGFRACGAGGGGCCLVYAEEGQKAQAAAIIQRLGGRILPYRFVRGGLKWKSA